VNRKRVLRVMRERKLIQRRTHEPHRRRPGFFQVERPGQLWHLDMTSIWVAEHGWVYLNAIIDCCTREIVGWQLSLRCRVVEAIAVIEGAVLEQAILPGNAHLGH
jgi:putative transposase